MDTIQGMDSPCAPVNGVAEMREDGVVQETKVLLWVSVKPVSSQSLYANDVL